jgi:hypothetical protein
MVKLTNGRGQLGEKLTFYFKNISVEEDITIYHTWKVPHLYNPQPGEEEAIQKEELNKLIDFSITNPKTKIIFISTNSTRDTWYTYYKELAEAYLLLNHPNCIILKFPLFIGEGVIKKLKTGELQPYGISEVITLDKVVNIIEKFLTYQGLKRVFYIEGEKIEALTILEILKIQ